MFDVDRDGVLSRDELHEMVVALLEVWKDNRTDTLPVSPHTHTHTLTLNIDVGMGGCKILGIFKAKFSMGINGDVWELTQNYWNKMEIVVICSNCTYHITHR